jgi:hypothetical protein
MPDTVPPTERDCRAVGGPEKCNKSFNNNTSTIFRKYL